MNVEESRGSLKGERGKLNAPLQGRNQGKPLAMKRFATLFRFQPLVRKVGPQSALYVTPRRARNRRKIGPPISPFQRPLIAPRLATAIRITV